MLKVMTACYGGTAWLAEALRPTIESLQMQLITIHEHPNANIKWDRFTWLDNLKQADIIIVPANYKIQPAKSANRLTQALALGKPVICSPLPAYLDVAKRHPGAFMIADSPEEWEEKLKILKESPSYREQLSQKALVAAQDYSIEVMGNKWLSIFLSPSEKSVIKQAVAEKVDIIIPTYKNLRGLKLCIESIRACTGIPYEIIVINNGDNEDMHAYLSGQKITYIRQKRLNFAQAVNIGIKAGNSPLICVLNDDVIVSKDWLSELVNSCGPNIGCVNPLSNCDKGWLHNYDLNIGGVELLPGTNSFEQIEPIISQIYEFKSPYQDLIEREWVAFFCTVMRRSVINKVGLLNEGFVNSGEDVDLCRRMTKMGYKNLLNFKSFCFHFGAVSRKELEKEDPEKYQDSDKKTNNLLRHLWDKKSVMIYSGPSWEAWSFKTMDTTGIGGSEVWVTWLSRKLSSLGYRVIVFADTRESELYDGETLWLPYTAYNAWIDQDWVDYAILSRTTDPLRYPLRAGKIFVQLHDVFLLSERNQLFLNKVTKFCCLSEWHRDFASDYHGIPKNKIEIMANGIEPDLFDGINVEKNPYRLHWSSSWDRGLDNVLYLWPFIKDQIPEAELHVYYGVFNWKSACIARNDKEGLKKIEHLEKAVLQPGVFTYGRVNQNTLREAELKSSLLLYPSWFSETFCCLPGTIIFTDKGLKCIEEISKEDRVYTHLAKYEKVLVSMNRDVDEYIYELSIKYLKDFLSITGEHPLLVLCKKDIKCKRINSCVCKRNSKRCQPGFCYFNKKGKKYYTLKKCKKLLEKDNPQWLEVKKIEKGDFVAYPLNKLNLELQNFSDFVKSDIVEKGLILTDRTKAGRPYSIKDFILDGDFLELCGWYVSEGHFNSDSQINFALNKNEEKEASFIESQLYKLGLKTHRNYAKDSNALSVVTSSVILGRFFIDNFGSGARNKYIPQWIKNLKVDYLKHFIKGLLRGDGSINKGTVVINSASERLMYDLFDVLLKFKCLSSLYKFKKPKLYKEGGKIKRDFSVMTDYYSLVCSVSQNKELFEFVGFKVEFFEKSNIAGFFDSNYAYFPVIKIKRKKYKGKVFNLEIEGDNSYVANGVIVHNCITGIECQYARTPVICNRYAGVKTTLRHPELGDTAIMLGNGEPYWPYTKEGREAFLNETISILKDREKWQHWSDLGRKNAERFSWLNVAKMWEKLF